MKFDCITCHFIIVIWHTMTSHCIDSRFKECPPKINLKSPFWGVLLYVLVEWAGYKEHRICGTVSPSPNRFHIEIINVFKSAILIKCSPLCLHVVAILTGKKKQCGNNRVGTAAEV